MHSRVTGIRVADGMPWRRLEVKLLQGSLLLDVSSCTEAGPDVTVVLEEKAAWWRTLWVRFFCALEMGAGLAGFSAASS